MAGLLYMAQVITGIPKSWRGNLYITISITFRNSLPRLAPCLVLMTPIN